MVQLSQPYMTTGKTIALTRQTFVDKAMSLLFNMLSRLVITFLPRSKCLIISWLQSPSSVILEPKKIKSVTVSIVFSSVCHEGMRPGHETMIFIFWMLSVKPAFSLSSFTLIKRLFSSSSLSDIRVVSSAYLRLWIFLPAISIPACACIYVKFVNGQIKFCVYYTIIIFMFAFPQCTCNSLKMNSVQVFLFWYNIGIPENFLFCKTHIKTPWRNRVKAGFSTQWTWVWVSSGSLWQTGKPGILQSMVSQRVRHDWVTELNWTEASQNICNFEARGGKWGRRLVF